MSLAVDGANIWCPNIVAATVTKLRAGDGTVLGTFPVAEGPDGIFYDGAHIWVANTYSNYSLTEFDPNDGTVLGVFPTSGLPEQIAFDGRLLWVTMVSPDGVSLFSPENGAPKGRLNIHGGPAGIVYDGQSMWISNYRADVVTKLTRGG